MFEFLNKLGLPEEKKQEILSYLSEKELQEFNNFLLKAVKISKGPDIALLAKDIGAVLPRTPDVKEKLNKALVSCAFGGDNVGVKVLLELGADVDYPDNFNVEEEIEKNVKISNLCNVTALHAAIISKHELTVMILLNTDANFQATMSFKKNTKNTYKNMTPLHMAAFVGNKKIIKILLQHGADYEAIGSKTGKAIKASALFSLGVNMVSNISPLLPKPEVEKGFAYVSVFDLDRNHYIKFLVQKIKRQTQLNIKSLREQQNTVRSLELLNLRVDKLCEQINQVCKFLSVSTLSNLNNQIFIDNEQQKTSFHRLEEKKAVPKDSIINSVSQISMRPPRAAESVVIKLEECSPNETEISSLKSFNLNSMGQ